MSRSSSARRAASAANCRRAPASTRKAIANMTAAVAAAPNAAAAPVMATAAIAPARNNAVNATLMRPAITRSRASSMRRVVSAQIASAAHDNPMRLIAPKASCARSGRYVSVSHRDSTPTVTADDTSNSATYPSRAFTDNSPWASF
jgi:hypothetical protein